MSLGDHIKKQDERTKDLAAKLHDLGCEFAEYMRKFDLATLPITDATGEVERRLIHPSDYTKMSHTVYCEPTGMRAFPLHFDAPAFSRIATSSTKGRCIAVTTDGELLFTETRAPGFGRFLLKGTHEKDGLAFHGGQIYELHVPYPCDDSTWQQLSERNPGVSTWQQLREKEQYDQLFRLSDAAYAHGLSYVIEPIELAMLEVYNSAQRR